MTTHSHAYGIIRREFLQVGFSGFLGFGLPGLLSGRSHASSGTPLGSASPRAKSMILIFTTGGLSHLDSLDMKPGAPEGIRGDFKPIDTKAPGVRICEHLPRLAAHADQFAIVRTLSHQHTNPPQRDSPAPDRLSTARRSSTRWPRDDYPCYASPSTTSPARRWPAERRDASHLPHGPLTRPGQHAGFLGPGACPGNPSGSGTGFASNLGAPRRVQRERLTVAPSDEISARDARSVRSVRSHNRPARRVLPPALGQGRGRSTSNGKIPGARARPAHVRPVDASARLSRRECRSSRRTWDACKPGTRTQPTSRP